MFGGDAGFAPLGEGTIILDLEDFIVSNNLLPLGAVIYLFKRMPYHHAIWHLAVLAGGACHYFAILWHVLP